MDTFPHSHCGHQAPGSHIHDVIHAGNHHGSSSVISSLSVESYRDFLSQSHGMNDGSVRYVYRLDHQNNHSHFASLGIAFGIAGSVFLGACGAAMKYISGKVDEERARIKAEQDKGVGK